MYLFYIYYLLFNKKIKEKKIQSILSIHTLIL